MGHVADGRGWVEERRSIPIVGAPRSPPPGRHPIVALMAHA